MDKKITAVLVGLVLFFGGIAISAIYVSGHAVAESQNLSSSNQVAPWNSYATSTAVTVGATSTGVAATSTGRSYLELFNYATSSIFCNVKNGAVATANSGILIAASSSKIISDVDTKPYTGAVNCINTQGTPTGVGVIEK